LTEYDYHLITDVRQDTQQATTINKQLTPCSLTDKRHVRLDTYYKAILL